jgi:hypothetical protein
MTRVSSGSTVIIAVALAVSVGSGRSISAQDESILKVQNGVAFSEFRGYEGWQVISISYNGGLMAVILGNPAMIDAFKAACGSRTAADGDGARSSTTRRPTR